MTLRIIISSHDGDKVKVNLPMVLVFACVNSGININGISNNDQFKNIDFKQIISLVEQGVVGNLVEVESSDGHLIKVSVE